MRILFHFLFMFLFVVILLFPYSCGISGIRDDEPYTLDEVPEPPKTGQWFRYQHTGPRPWGESEVDASGTRLVRVIGSQEEKKKIYWLIEETFSADGDSQISIYAPDYKLHRQLSRSDAAQAVYKYNPPLSDRHLELKVDQEKTEESEVSITNPQTGQDYGMINLTRTTKRVRDERIVTEAGAYLCRHFVSETKITYQFQNTTTQFSAKENTYWCDQLAWFVLETIEVEPAIQEGDFIGTGHTSESRLVDFEQTP